MFSALAALLDPYNRRARFQPVIWSLLPILVAFVLLIPEFQGLWSTIAWLVVCGGGATFLTQLGRGRGKALEPMLYRLWDGKPSVAMLRHQDNRLSMATKARYRNFLQRTVPGLRLASPDEEKKYPAQADDGYEGATSWLLSQTRDHERFGLLFQENINYGFRRNIWGLKPWALASGPVAIAMVLAFESDAWSSGAVATLSTINLAGWICIATAVTHILVFAFLIRSDWVRMAADAYALQLLASCDILETRRQS